MYTPAKIPGLIVLFALLVSLPAILPAELQADDTPVHAFVGAHLIPIVGEEIPDGVLLVRGDEIAAVGTRDAVKIPKNAVVHDVSGKIIMPGLVDTHSHIGGGGAGDGSAPLHPEVRIYDSIDARAPGFNRARAGGLTTLNVMPGSGHLMSGQTAYLKLRGEPRTIDDLSIVLDDGRLAGGMKMANGTNSRRDPPFPGTRGKSAALVREKFVAAQAYREKLTAAAEDPEKAPERDLAMEALVEVLEGKRVVHHHTHRHDDILTVLRLKEEFGFKVVLQHVSEAWMVADEIAASGASSSLIVIDSPGGKEEAINVAFKSGAVLEEAGAEVIGFHTDDWISDSRIFLRSAALAVRAGMSRSGALKGMTLAGAQMMELEDRIGSLETGKDADFIVLSGDPLSVYTQVLQTWVEGENVFDYENPDHRLIAEGGWGAGDRRPTHVACFDHEEDNR